MSSAIEVVLNDRRDEVEHFVMNRNQALVAQSGLAQHIFH